VPYIRSGPKAGGSCGGLGDPRSRYIVSFDHNSYPAPSSSWVPADAAGSTKDPDDRQRTLRSSLTYAFMRGCGVQRIWLIGTR
jgi:hypothetical protein